MEFHHKNGGLSRYVKFRYFYETIRNEKVTDEMITNLAQTFSDEMKHLLIDSNLLIQET